jgi:uncharacterized protein
VEEDTSEEIASGYSISPDYTDLLIKKGRHRMCRCLALSVTLFSLFLIPIAYAGFDDANSAYERGDYLKAYKEIKSLAEQGYAKAQCNLGVLYAKGQGVVQSYSEAVKWFRKAAEQGYADAQYNLAVMYYTGEGVPMDEVEAVKWLLKAAEQGNVDAKEFLQEIYAKS